jgi:hypothetical protein
MTEKLYTVKFFLNDGEVEEIIKTKVPLGDLLNVITMDIHDRFPEWDWHVGTNGWADVCVHDDGRTYIRVNGVGDVWKGVTYYIVWNEDDVEKGGENDEFFY